LKNKETFIANTLWSLSKHYENIRYQSGIKFPNYTLSTHKDKNKWAYVDFGKQAIFFNEDFLINYSMTDIMAALYHEIAHVIAIEYFSGGEEKSHGSSFKEACRILGIDSRASHNFTPLISAMAGKDKNREARIHRVLNHIVSREPESEGARREAEIAKEKLKALKDFGVWDTPPEYVSVMFWDFSARTPNWKYAMAHMLSDTFNLKAIWRLGHVRGTKKKARAAEFMGHRDNILLAHYTYDALVNAILPNEWKKFKKGVSIKLGVHAKNEFYQGLLISYLKRIKEAANNFSEEIVSGDEATTTSIIIHPESKALSEQWENRWSSTSKTNRRAGAKSRGTGKFGSAAGDNVSLRRGVNTSTQKKLSGGAK